MRRRSNDRYPEGGSPDDSSRHLVFSSQDFTLDLRMDYERSVRDVVVVGQLLSRDRGPVSDVATTLVCANRIVSQDTTGRLGEFHLECRPRGPLHLQLAVNEEQLIDVELDRARQSELRPVLVERDELILTDHGAPADEESGA